MPAGPTAPATASSASTPSAGRSTFPAFASATAASPWCNTTGPGRAPTAAFFTTSRAAPAAISRWSRRRKANANPSTISTWISGRAGCARYDRFLRQQRLPLRRGLGAALRRLQLVVERARLARRAAAHAEPDHPHAAPPRPAGQGNDVAEPQRMVGLGDDGAVDRYRAGAAQPRGERAALGEAGEPQPLIEPPGGKRGVGQARLSSFNLANGLPSAAGRGRRAGNGRRRRGANRIASCGPATVR